MMTIKYYLQTQGCTQACQHCSQKTRISVGTCAVDTRREHHDNLLNWTFYTKDDYDHTGTVRSWQQWKHVLLNIESVLGTQFKLTNDHGEIIDVQAFIGRVESEQSGSVKVDEHYLSFYDDEGFLFKEG